MQSKFFFLIFLATIFSSYKNEESKKVEIHVTENGLEIQEIDSKNIFEQKFRNLNEIAAFKDFEEIESSVMDLGNDDYRYGFNYIKNDSISVLIFEEILDQDQKLKKFRILDTLEIRNLKEFELLIFGLCSQDEKFDGQIAAVVNSLDNKSENFDKIKRAWKANVVIHKFEEIKNIKGIKCINISP